MFERFTDQARQVVVFAQEEALMLGHNYIGTEHILLGLLRDEDGVCARVLESLEVTLEGARARVARLIGASGEPAAGQIPFTPRGKKALELALREALSAGHNYIGPEHILLGILREKEGVAARILLDFGADPETIRNAVIQMLPEPEPQILPVPESRLRARRPSASLRGEPRRVPDRGWLGGLGPLLDRLAAEIRDELGRDADPGDLLVALACASQTVASRALSDLGLEVDALWGAIERVRRQDVQARRELEWQTREVAGAKVQAIEAQEFEKAAELRDRERELRQQARSREALPAEVLNMIRRHLGIPTPPEDPPASPVS